MYNNLIESLCILLPKNFTFAAAERITCRYKWRYEGFMSQSIKLTVQTLVVAGLLSIAALFLTAAPRASATLAGENGPIVYVEETEERVDCEDVEVSIQQEAVSEYECYDESTEVVTTDDEGQNPVTAAESGDDEEITTATISPNNAQGQHTIVYASSGNGDTCIDYVLYSDLLLVDTTEVVVDEDYCYYYDSEARIYRVLLDANRQPIGQPVLVTVATGPEGAITYENFYYELSYGPDGNSVVGVRFFYAEGAYYDRLSEDENGQYGPNYTIEHINLSDGTITTLVEPKYDPYLNAGYSQNGTIYFTQMNHAYEDDRISESIAVPVDYTSNVWYFAAGSMVPTQLTFTSEVNEYFLSVSPDSKKILVCDAYNFQFYIVDALTGELTLVEIDWESEDAFLPLFFSPDGSSFLGFKGSAKYFYDMCGGRMVATRALAVALDTEEELTAGVAIAALNDFQNAMIVNGMENPDDWAPVVTYTTSTPQVLGATTITPSKKLQSTGSTQVLAALATGIMIALIAGFSVAYRNEE